MACMKGGGESSLSSETSRHVISSCHFVLSDENASFV